MTVHQSAYDESQGKPNLEVLQYLQDNWGVSEIAGSLQVAKVEVTATSSGATGVAATIPVGAEIIDAHTICTGANGGGTMTVRTAAAVPTNITDAMACATDEALARATSIDDAVSVVTVDGIEVIANAAGDLGNVYITYKK